MVVQTKCEWYAQSVPQTRTIVCKRHHNISKILFLARRNQYSNRFLPQSHQTRPKLISFILTKKYCFLTQNNLIQFTQNDLFLKSA